MNIAWAWAGLAEVTPWLLRFTVAGTLVTALAHVLGSTLLRNMAVARVDVWRTTVLALLVVPILALTLPGRWTLPGGFVVLRPGTTEAERSLGPLPAVSGDEMGAPAQLVTESTPAPTEVAAPVELAVPEMLAPLIPSAVADVTVVGPSGSVLPGLVSGPIEPFSAMAFLWIAVAGWFLLQLMAGLIALDVHARRAPVVTREMLHLLPAAAKRPGRQVQVLRGGPFRVPVCWGVLKPRILLPYASSRWSTARLQAVLLHEAAHVERRDGLFLILARVACAVHWINPLAWGLLRRLSIDAEAACDSAVLRAGVPPRYYAKVLVDVASEARNSRRPEAAMALALLRTGTLTWRVTRILDPRAMAPVARWVTNSAGAVLLIGTLVGATVTLEPEADLFVGEPAASEETEETVGPEQSSGELGQVYQVNIVSPEQLPPEDPRASLAPSMALADQDARALESPVPIEPLEIGVTLAERDAAAALQTLSGMSATDDRVSRVSLDLPLLEAPPPAAPRPRTSVEMPRRAPRITGTLVEEGTQRPIQLAQINLVTGHGETVTGVLTDRNGWFSVAAPSAGQFFLHASALGYRETTTSVTVVGDVGVTFAIPPTPVALSGVEVRGLPDQLTASGFYDRKERGFGRFFGPTDLSAAQTLAVSDLLTTVPRVSVIPDTDGNRVVMSGPLGRCGPRVFLDGALVSVDGREIDKILSRSTLDGLEVYQNAVQVPVQWSGSLTERAPCGAIVAWTKE